MMTATHTPLAQSLWGSKWNSEKQNVKIWQRGIILSILGSVLLVISAHIKIPFYPVPITMQPFAVMMIGMMLGARLGGATVLLYLAYGIAGLPVFAGGVGAATLIGPTGGYLIGFFFAAIACGALAERGFDRSILRTFIAVFIATAIIYIFGLLWLGTVIGWDKPVLKYGFYPFIIGDVIKMALAAILLPLIWKKLK